MAVQPCEHVGEKFMRREMRILFDYTDCGQLCSNAVPQSFAFLRAPVCQELRGFYCPTARQRTQTHVRMIAYHMSAVIFDVCFLLSLLAADVRQEVSILAWSCCILGVRSNLQCRLGREALDSRLECSLHSPASFLFCILV